MHHHIDPNKAYPKNNFLFLKINQFVDTTSRYKLLSLIDAFFGYNQIKMAPEEGNIAFMTRKVFIIKNNAFWFKDYGSSLSTTGQQSLQKSNRVEYEGYVDDMLIKSSKESDHIQDLDEAFAAFH